VTTNHTEKIMLTVSESSVLGRLLYVLDNREKIRELV